MVRVFDFQILVMIYLRAHWKRDGERKREGNTIRNKGGRERRRGKIPLGIREEEREN
jgi:hypothetical protein